MNIFGIGTDITNTSRIKKSIKKKNFLRRIYNDKEIIKCKSQNNKINCYAKRFAAKEAFSKAVGTGISSGISFKEIVIYNIKSGKPSIKLIGNTKKIVDKKLKNKKYKTFLSLSDDAPYATATVILTV